jgi:hypothetical protein
MLRKIEKTSENLHNVFIKNYCYDDLINECRLDRLLSETLKERHDVGELGVDRRIIIR